MDKVAASAEAAVEVVDDGNTIMVGGFGAAGFPMLLRRALVERRRRNLTIVCNNADFGGLAESDALSALICSFPTGPSSAAVLERIKAGDTQLTIVPQGTLAERIRAAGAGLGGVLTPTGVGAEFSEGLRIVEVDGKEFVLAEPLPADVALLRAWKADHYGNLVCRKAARNFNPLMAMAATFTIAEVEEVVGVGELDPDEIHIPGAFIDAVVRIGSDT